MKTLSKLLFAPLFALAFLLFSCSSDDDEDVQANCGPSYCVADLQGTWNATRISFSYCGGGMIDPSFVDIIEAGATATMVVQSNGRFTLTITFPDQTTESISGKIYFENNTWFAIQFDDDPPNDPTYFGDALSNNKTVFELTGGPETAEFDFDDDGEEECASVSLRLEKV